MCTNCTFLCVCMYVCMYVYLVYSFVTKHSEYTEGFRCTTLTTYSLGVPGAYWQPANPPWTTVGLAVVFPFALCPFAVCPFVVGPSAVCPSVVFRPPFDQRPGDLNYTGSSNKQIKFKIVNLGRIKILKVCI